MTLRVKSSSLRGERGGRREGEVDRVREYLEAKLRSRYLRFISFIMVKFIINFTLLGESDCHAETALFVHFLE